MIGDIFAYAGGGASSMDKAKTRYNSVGTDE